MEILGLSVSTQKAAPNETPQKITLTEGGVLGDRHAGDGMRQVSIMLEQHAQLSLKNGDTKVTPGANKENILLRGFSGTPVSLLDQFCFGAALLEVTEIGAALSPTGQGLCPSNAVCGVSDYGIFARVKKTGELRIGDAGEYRRRRLRAHIITLSDRAAAGKYPDRSGAKIEEMLVAFAESASWDAAVERILITDDADALRQALASAKNAGIELVITSGGTGVAPRDITPETILAMADKTIPGIMEHVRWKYGQHNPKAYLSRSVTATMGETLVYALPGSVKAVEEYMAEILHTLEHLLLTLRGLQLH